MRVSVSWLPFASLLLLAAFAPVWYLRLPLLVLLVPVLCIISSFHSLSKRHAIDPARPKARCTPVFSLNTFPVSHYVEKIRWVLDEIGGEAADDLYEEEMDVGIIGVFFVGRTVPTLYHADGTVTAGNSAHIVRYLYAYFLADGRDVGEEEQPPAEHQSTNNWSAISNGMRERALELLKPTPERVQWEADIDRVAHDVQMLVYTYLLGSTKASIRLWGVSESGVPLWQRLLLRVMGPVLTVLMRSSLHGPPGVTKERSEASTRNLLRMFDRIDAALSDGRAYITGNEICYIDLWWSACIGLVFSPKEYGNGRCSRSTIQWDDTALPREAVEFYKANIDRPSVQFAFRLYADRRCAFQSLAAS